jgi:hypothetical protein
VNTIKRFLAFSFLCVVLGVILDGIVEKIDISDKRVKPLSQVDLMDNPICHWKATTLGSTLFDGNGLALVTVQHGFKGEVYARTWEHGNEHERVYVDNASAMLAFGKMFAKDCRL